VFPHIYFMAMTQWGCVDLADDRLNPFEIEMPPPVELLPLECPEWNRHMGKDLHSKAHLFHASRDCDA
jgi:hypothetical protein